MFFLATLKEILNIVDNFRYVNKRMLNERYTTVMNLIHLTNVRR